ncbi:hypothetical protein HYQ46_009379 [Verticillium longisporum]|nr:hypothetical protein HYQ46_009379 [Verticillium longisporum]
MSLISIGREYASRIIRCTLNHVEIGGLCLGFVFTVHLTTTCFASGGVGLLSRLRASASIFSASSGTKASVCIVSP